MPKRDRKADKPKALMKNKAVRCRLIPRPWERPVRVQMARPVAAVLAAAAAVLVAVELAEPEVEAVVLEPVGLDLVAVGLVVLEPVGPERVVLVVADLEEADLEAVVVRDLVVPGLVVREADKSSALLI